MDSAILGRILGVGGFGTVFGENRNGRFVAIKRLPSHLHPRSLRREIENLQHLSHPNIVEYIEFYESDEGKLANIVTEYYERGDLKKFINRREQCYSISLVIDWACQLFGALVYLEGKRIFHRDIKASNILLGQTYEMKLCDFGLSKSEEAENSNYGVVGTMRYTPPETFGIIKDRQIFTYASDLYASGLVLWECIERRVVFHDANPLIPRICFGEPLERANCRDCMADLIETCVRKMPDDRPTASKALEKAKAIKHESFYKRFCMEPYDLAVSPDSDESAPVVGAKETWMDEIIIDKTITKNSTKTSEVDDVTIMVGALKSTVLSEMDDKTIMAAGGQTQAEAAKIVLNASKIGMNYMRSINEACQMSKDVEDLTIRVAKFDDEDEITLRPLSFTSSNPERRSESFEENCVELLSKSVEIGSAAPYPTKFSTIEEATEPLDRDNGDFTHVYGKLMNLPSTSTASYPEEDSGFVEKSFYCTPVRPAPPPPPPKVGWAVPDTPKFRAPMDYDPLKEREKLHFRYSLPTQNEDPPAVPQRKLTPASAPPPPLRHISLKQDKWVSDKLLMIWCRSLVTEHPTWCIDTLYNSLSTIVREKNEAKLKEFFSRVLLFENGQPNGPGSQLGCVLKLQIGGNSTIYFLKGFDLFFRNFLRRCDYFTNGKSVYMEAVEYCFDVLSRRSEVYQKAAMLFLAFDLVAFKEWSTPFICETLGTTKEFLTCHIAKSLLSLTEELPNEAQRILLRSEVDSLRYGGITEQRFFIQRALP